PDGTINVAERMQSTHTVELPGPHKRAFPATQNAISIETLPEWTESAADVEVRDWQQVTVKRGDSLALIFKRLSLSPSTLHTIMHTNVHAETLKKIKPGQVLRFDIQDGELRTMEYDVAIDKTLVVENSHDRIMVMLDEIELKKKIRHATATINNSLYLDGQAAGLSDNVIMQLVTIYGWDIDFALDIRKGDAFSVMYEELYKDGIKVDDGPILAAEFTNRGKSFRAVRFTHANGDKQYYADSGHSMRKAFLRTPVRFSRISSRFNLRRKHPILNRIRAHRGVDYAAPTGTPVKATGDGVVTYRGTKGGYGRTVAIRHGSTYSTLYAHLSRYGKKIRNGTRVKQGQIIGYVGRSGLATGPHLHYEFRVHGVHRNPLTVKLPKAMKIPDELMDEFKLQTTPLLARLDDFNQETQLANSESGDNPDLIAMNKESLSPTTTQ
ncbi:MAG: peptidoglycan DD-metalloendopeptidase family protein, partial [Thiotrichales bacterium]|nr:peptidoglycan DD-metalloendopeptidase family protein [Thiotrichales bacterium]